MNLLKSKKSILILILVLLIISAGVWGILIINKITISKNIIGMTTSAPREFIPKDTKKIVYGFLPYWSIENYNKDFSKITDLVYFTLYLHADGSINKDDNSYIYWNKSKKLETIFDESNLNGVRNHLTIAIHENTDIESFLDCKSCYQNSLNQIRDEINSKKYINGVNFDFEYVGLVSGKIPLAYSDYIAYMSNNLKQEYGKDFMIVVSAYGDSVEKPRITSLKDLDRPEIDYIFIMAYDYFRPSSDKAGPVSPLGGRGKDYTYDVNSTVTDFLKYVKGDRLILGIPLYGINYIVEDATPYSQRIPGTDYTGFSVQQNLSDIETLKQRENISEIKWDEASSTPYFTYFNSDGGVNRLIFFENDRSLNLKVDLVKKNELRGIGFWALGYEGASTKILEFSQNYFTID